jgi:hypothetical protein
MIANYQTTLLECRNFPGANDFIKPRNGGSEPSNPKLYATVVQAAKDKFDVYPSAVANSWVVQEYKRRGGTYKSESKTACSPSTPSTRSTSEKTTSTTPSAHKITDSSPTGTKRDLMSENLNTTNNTTHI